MAEATTTVADKVELVIHPVRLRILLSLDAGPLTTQEISEQLADVPKSSLYRHLRLLLDGEFVAVAETRLVQGIQEKVYQLNRPARLGPEDIAGVSAEDHLRYFTTYLMVLLRGFSSYLASAKEVDLLEDRVGYSEVSFWATRAELDQLARTLNEAIMPLLENGPEEGRRRHKLATIMFPENERRKQ